VLELPEELARLDALLDDPVFFAPSACYFDPLTGRPCTPVECYLRLMFLKFRRRSAHPGRCRTLRSTPNRHRQPSRPPSDLAKDADRSASRPRQNRAICAQPSGESAHSLGGSDNPGGPAATPKASSSVPALAQLHDLGLELRRERAALARLFPMLSMIGHSSGDKPLMMDVRQNGHKFRSRYATFGFVPAANLDEGDMWPTSFAQKRLTADVEERIAALVKTAVS
jgi:hypothetical protein